MGKIFLIYSNDGGFEPQNYVLGYKTSEEEAKTSVEALKVDYHKARAFNDSIHEAYRKFNEENESPLIRMRLERNDIVAKNQKTIEENSKAYAEWQLKQMEYVKPLINAVANEPWFEKWFDLGERFISCSACGLVEDYEFIYEECEELK